MVNKLQYSLQSFLLCLFVNFLDHFLECPRVHVLTPSTPSRAQLFVLAVLA